MRGVGTALNLNIVGCGVSACLSDSFFHVSVALDCYLGLIWDSAPHAACSPGFRHPREPDAVRLLIVKIIN